MLKYFISWLETFLFVVGVTLVLKIVSLVFLGVRLDFFKSFGITIFVINILGLASQLYRTSKNSEDNN